MIKDEVTSSCYSRSKEGDLLWFYNWTISNKTLQVGVKSRAFRGGTEVGLEEGDRPEEFNSMYYLNEQDALRLFRALKVWHEKYMEHTGIPLE